MLSAFFFCLAGGMFAQLLLLPGAMAESVDGKFLGAVLHVVFFHVGSLCCVAWMLRKEGTGWTEAFGLAEGGRLKAILIGVGAALLATPCTMLLQQAMALTMESGGVQPEVQETVKVIRESVALDQQIFYGLLAVVFAPVTEELLFRGVFYQALKSYGFRKAAVWGTSLLFALVHYNFLTFIPLTFLALVFIGVYERTGNLLAPIAAHSCFNSINFTLLIFGDEIQQWAARATT
jgi:membrane protease YdiL (CAAX protease family)